MTIHHRRILLHRRHHLLPLHPHRLPRHRRRRRPLLLPHLNRRHRCQIFLKQKLQMARRVQSRPLIYLRVLFHHHRLNLILITIRIVIKLKSSPRHSNIY